ncbi:hypothetical protein PUN28_020598 [Cardiocondyla obscurior]|uniref:Secreted protein n=1 Tax=Cardiocondyla obscurior TaxID=286306 RepID=A0AAW2E5U1_9HYME
MHTGLFSLLFSPAAEICIVRQLKKCIRVYSEPFIFTSSRDMMHLGLFRFFIFIRSRDMAKKRKKIFLKFYNVALCGN